MTANRRIIQLALIALLMLVAVAPAGAVFAQEHGGELTVEDDHAAADDHGEAHFAVPTTAQYIYKWINFIMLAVVLYWLLVVPPVFVQENFEFEGLKVILAARSKAIVDSRDLAKEQAVQATEGLATSAARLERVEEEAAGLVAQAREAAEHDKVKIVEEATAQAEAIRTGASRDMKSEVTRAERELQSHIGHLAVGIATDLVKKNFSGADQDRLVRDYLDQLGESVS